MNYKEIEYQTQGAIARIWHNRPDRSNAESTLMLDEMDRALADAEADDAIRVIIIAGRGKHFSAGHDIKEGLQRPDDVEQRWYYEEQRYLHYALRLWDCPKPTIAQVNGACIAGAFVVANMCDLVVMSDDAYFSDPVCHSFGTAATEVLVHPWVMGLRAAKEFLYTGEKLSANDAYRIGLANRVVLKDSLERETERLAERIAEAPPFAVRLTKRSLNRSLDIQGFRNALQAHFDTHQLSHTSQEFRDKIKGL